LAREIKEELDIIIKEYSFIGEFFYEDGASSKVYTITKWEGEPKPIEAEEFMWVSDENQLSKEVDKNMLKKAKQTLK
jgi:8-oxo-dGTP pyrophosphatase MutT (NUDIX family)